MEKKKQFSCVVCEKSCTEKGNLKTHMLIHSGVKNFSCNQCNKSFTQSGALKIHQNIHLMAPLRYFAMLKY